MDPDSLEEWSLQDLYEFTEQTQNTCTWEALATTEADDWLGSSSMEKVLA